MSFGDIFPYPAEVPAPQASAWQDGLPGEGTFGIFFPYLAGLTSDRGRPVLSRLLQQDIGLNLPKCPSEQHCFGNPPAVVSRLPLVDAVHEERDDIDEYNRTKSRGRVGFRGLWVVFRRL